MDKAPEPFTTLCFNCRNPYDALPASFCGCNGADRTLVCPSCGRCFCHAPAGYKQGFWMTAPEPVWKRRARLLEDRPR